MKYFAICAIFSIFPIAVVADEIPNLSGGTGPVQMSNEPVTGRMSDEPQDSRATLSRRSSGSRDSGGDNLNSFSTSPYNWRNSQSNFENSSSNFRNSPYNFQNSPAKYGNRRIIRDNDGKSIGYKVEKEDGGANIFDMEGNRIGYEPAR